GVQIRDVRRMGNSLLDSAVDRNASESGSVSAQLDTLRQVEALLAPGEGSVNDLLEGFFNQLQQLSNQPTDQAQRRVVLGSANSLAKGINNLSNELNTLSEGLNGKIVNLVDQINNLSPQIADLNSAIQRGTIDGANVNDLIDQRDQLISQLAQLTDVQVVPQDHGVVNVLSAGV